MADLTEEAPGRRYETPTRAMIRAGVEATSHLSPRENSLSTILAIAYPAMLRAAPPVSAS